MPRFAALVSLSVLLACGSGDSAPDEVPLKQAAAEFRQCSRTSDCEVAPFDAPVTSPAECPCILCQQFAVSSAGSLALSAAYGTHCEFGVDGAGEQCPIASCAAPPDVHCSPAGLCEFAVRCETDADCGTTSINRRVTEPSECPCPSCPTALSITAVEEWRTAYAQHCQRGVDGQGNACQVPDCEAAQEPRCITNRCTVFY